MSVKQFIERVTVKREHFSKVAFFDDLENEAVLQNNLNRTAQSQIEIGNVKQINRHAAYLEKQARRGRIYYYMNHEKLKERKRLQSKNFRLKNPSRACELTKAWRAKNPEKVKQFQHQRYLRRKASMTPDEYKAWQREKNKQAKERKIAQIGIKAYRAQERERVKRHYENNPQALQRNRERNKERMRLKRQQQKEAQP